MKPEPQTPVMPCSNCGRRDGWQRSPTKHRGGWYCVCRETPDQSVQRYRTPKPTDTTLLVDSPVSVTSAEQVS